MSKAKNDPTPREGNRIEDILSEDEQIARSLDRTIWTTESIIKKIDLMAYDMGGAKPDWL